MTSTRSLSCAPTAPPVRTQFDPSAAVKRQDDGEEITILEKLTRVYTFGGTGLSLTGVISQVVTCTPGFRNACSWLMSSASTT